MVFSTFFRKCPDIKSLKNNLVKFPSFGQRLEYVIVCKKVLNATDYKEFTNNFLCDFDFIATETDKLFMDNSDCVHCMLVTNDNRSGVLVYPSGFSYARYVALWKNKGGD